MSLTLTDAEMEVLQEEAAMNAHAYAGLAEKAKHGTYGVNPKDEREYRRKSMLWDSIRRKLEAT